MGETTLSTTNVEYDIRGRKTVLTDPDAGTTTYTYDALGQLMTQTDAKNQTTTLVYDPLGRMTHRFEPDHTSQFFYDTIESGCSAGSKVIGRQTRLITTTGYEKKTCFDDFARPVTDTTVLGYVGGPTLAVSTVYDSAGRVDRMSYPSGFEVQNVYGAYGHHTQVNNYNGGAALWTLNALDGYGHITSETTASGTGARDTLRTYDFAGRLTTLKVGTGANPTLLENAGIGYDAIHNVASRSWYDGTQARSESLTLDVLNRVTQVSGASSRSYDYDLRGNLTNKNGLTLTYLGSGASRPHAVVSVTGSVNGVVNPTYEYDANGNLLFEKQSGVERRKITWTSYNMPSQIFAYTQASALVASSSFSYGPNHERVKQILESGGTTTTTYYLHGPQYEEVTVGGTTTKKAYIRAGGRIVALAETVSGSTAIKYFGSSGSRVGKLTV
jgi:YD repeat-containing protein